MLLESGGHAALNLRMKAIFSLMAGLLLVACSGPPQPLVVKQYLLRDQVRRPGDEVVVGMEKERRLYGAVSMEERRQRLGQYYTMLWSDPAGAGQGKVDVVFLYQQGGTGSLVKRAVKSFPASATEGIAEFSVIGDNYFKGGRVLAWKTVLTRGGKELASRKSYLWQ
jgi:hypothetical protein